METHYMDVKPLFYKELVLEIGESVEEDKHWHNCHEIIWLFRGAGLCFTEGKNVLLKDNSIHICNPLENHAMEVEAGSLFVRLYIPKQLVDRLDNSEFVSPSGEWTGSQTENNRLRFIIAQLTQCYLNKKNGYELFVQQYLIMLVICLSTYFENYSESQKYKTQTIHEIKKYIYDHYSEELSLNRISEAFHFSSTYFSKMFRKETGISFKEYLSHVRIQSARYDLLNTKNSITQIAEDNGYPSIKSLGMEFKKYYGISPSAFREKEIVSWDDTKPNLTENEMEKTSSAMEVAKYLDEVIINGEQQAIIPEQKQADVLHITMKQKSSPMKYAWKEMINVGNAIDILNSDVQQQLKELQEMIHFKYVHFHGLLNDSMKVYNEDKEGKARYSFFYIDKVIDFILGINAKPYIELGYMPRLLANRFLGDSIAGGYMMPPKRMQKWIDLIQALLQHFIKRYSRREVESWKYQIWDNADVEEWWSGDFDEFCWLYQNTYNVIRQNIPKAEIGTPGITSYMAVNSDWMERFLEFGIKQSVKPDFISLVVYPHDKYNPLITCQSNERIALAKLKRILPSSNAEYMRDTLNLLKQKLKRHGMEALPIYITQWNLSHQIDEVTNGTAFGAAYFVKNICDCYTVAKSFGYWFLSDTMGLVNVGSAFVGGKGLINNDGIKKPIYFALQFMNELTGRVVCNQKGIFITADKDRYAILLYHYVHYKKSYCRGEWTIKSIGEVYSCFESRYEKEVNLCLNDIQPGEYKVEQFTINREKGSSFDNWLQLGAFDYADRNDVLYLKSVSYPEKRSQYEIIEDRYHIYKKLKPHEVCLYLIKRQE